MLRSMLTLAFALQLLACDDAAPGSCLPAARAEPETIVGEQPLTWYCVDPPPAYVLDGSLSVWSVWVEGESCDPCDLERIAGLAAAQVCSGTTPPHLLCGPLPFTPQPWERKGCYYAVAAATDCLF